MADTKITDLAEDTAPAAGDFLVSVDVSDTSGAASGTNKKVKVSSLKSGLALDSAVVHVTGAETVAGAKTFTSPIAADLAGTPHAPTPSIGDNSTRIATTEWVTEQGYLGGIPSTLVAHVTLNTPSVLYATPINFTVSGGTATGTLALLAQAANTVLAGPTTGTNAAPTMRALVAADIPALDAAKVTSGNVALAQLGTGTPAAGKYVDGGTGAWTTLPTGGGGGLTVGGAVSGGGANRVLYEDGSANLAASANLTYDGSNLTTNGIQAAAEGQRIGGDASGRFSVTAYGISSQGTPAPGEVHWGTGSGMITFQSGYLTLGSACVARWSSADPVGTPCDVGVHRSAEGVLQVDNGAVGSGLGDLLLRSPIIRRNSAPADAELSAGDVIPWLDATNGASKLMVKAKSANGTVVTGSLALS